MIDKSLEPAGGVRGNQPRQHKHLLDAAYKQLEIQRVMLANERKRKEAAEQAAARAATGLRARLIFWSVVFMLGLGAWAYGVLA